MLLILRARPKHGYDLIARLKELGIPVDGPQVYRLLHVMEAEGLVRSKWRAGRGPTRRVYRVTARGTRRLAQDTEELSRVAANLQLYSQHYAELARHLDRRRAERG